MCINFVLTIYFHLNAKFATVFRQRQLYIHVLKYFGNIFISSLIYLNKMQTYVESKFGSVLF